MGEQTPITKRKQAYDKTGGRCAYCGKLLDFDDFEIDHLVPKVAGGSREIENLMASCAPCNRLKGGFRLGDFRRFFYGPNYKPFYFECTPEVRESLWRLWKT